jgi:hypothetical protein
MTSELVIRTSKITALADVVSAYSLAYVAQLYIPVQAFLPATVDPNASQGLALVLLGGVFTSLLIILDPVNKIVGKILPVLINKPTAWWRTWALQVAIQIMPKRYAPAPGTEEEFYVGRAKYSYWSTYMSKWRTQITGAVILSIFLFGLIPRAVALNQVGLAVAIFVIGTIVLYSISRDVSRKIPGYCWNIAIYGLMVQFMPKEEKDSLDRIAKNLSDANWADPNCLAVPPIHLPSPVF